MSVNKIDRRALKRPDKFQTFFWGLFEKLRANATPIIGVLVAAAIITVGVAAYLQHKGGKAEEAQYRFAKLQETVGEAQAMDSIEARREALRSVSADLQTFYNDYENTDAGRNSLFAIGQVQFQLGNYEAAANAFQKAASRTGKLPSFQAMAFVEAGKSWEALGEYGKAIEYYQRSASIEGNPYAKVIESDIGRLRALQSGSAAPNTDFGLDH